MLGGLKIPGVTTVNQLISMGFIILSAGLLRMGKNRGQLNLAKTP
jgi:hypothetical protein